MVFEPDLLEFRQEFSPDALASNRKPIWTGPFSENCEIRLGVCFGLNFLRSFSNRWTWHDYTYAGAVESWCKRMADQDTCMLTARQQARLWELLICSKARFFYFAELASSFKNQQRWLNVLSVLLSSGSLAAVWYLPAVAPMQTEVKTLITLAATVVSALTLNFKNHERVQTCSELQIEWGKLEIECEFLWDDLYSKECSKTLKQLEEKALLLSARATSLPARRKNIERWTNIARERAVTNNQTRPNEGLELDNKN